LSNNFNTFLSESVDLIKTNQSEQCDSEYYNDYTSASSINTDITKKILKALRTSILMIINLSQKQIQIINDTVQTAVTTTLKKFNSQAESLNSSEFSRPEK